MMKKANHSEVQEVIIEYQPELYYYRSKKSWLKMKSHLKLYKKTPVNFKTPLSILLIDHIVAKVEEPNVSTENVNRRPINTKKYNIVVVW